MAQPSPKNSSSKDGKEPCTEDGWTFEEVMKFEKVWSRFDSPSPAFFQQVAREMPWKTIKAIRLHYQLMIRDLDIILNSERDLIGDDAGGEVHMNRDEL